ncbi:MAG: TolB family protein, partial [Bradymonadaceae bacterium]
MSRRFLALDGDPAQSRLLKKGLPLDEGGIVHRGGNRTFFQGLDDVAARELMVWARLERSELAGEEEAEVLGVVFVRGPVGPEPIFGAPVFQPGSDIFLRRSPGADGEDINLTGHLHDGEADIRQLAISPSAESIVFSMRRDENAGYQLYRMELDTLEARQLTHDPSRLPSGAVTTNLMPVFGGNGELYFVSNRHDRLAERGDGLDLSIYRLDPDSEEPRRLTFTPGPEINPRLFNVGAFQGYLVFPHRRAIGSRDETVGFSFPLDLHTDYHIFFGVTAPHDHFIEFVEMPDGRALTIATDTSN